MDAYRGVVHKISAKENGRNDACRAADNTDVLDFARLIWEARVLKAIPEADQERQRTKQVRIKGSVAQMRWMHAVAVVLVRGC